MRIQRMALVATLSVAGLIGCSKSAPPSDGLPAANAPAGAVAAKAPTNPLASLKVVPGLVHACEGQDRIASNVSWRVDDPKVTTVRVEVDSATDPKRSVFAIGGTTGEQKTDQWVGAGVRFHLIDTGTNAELTSYEVTSEPCN